MLINLLKADFPQLSMYTCMMMQTGKVISKKLFGILFGFMLLSCAAESISLPEIFGGYGGMVSKPELPVTEAQIGPIEGVMAVALVESLALGNAWMAREVPTPYGVGMIVLSPMAAMKNINSWGNATLMAGVAGLGLYDALNHGKEPAMRKKRFWVTYAAIHLVIVPAYAVNYLTGGVGQDESSRTVSARMDFDPDRTAFVVTTRF